MASPSSTVRPPTAPPTRNKSSTTLNSTSTSIRAKRNKSSSSLHAGHHNVSFTHHGKKPAHKRTGSTGRKPQIDFGFTSMKQEEVVRRGSDEEDGDVDGVGDGEAGEELELERDEEEEERRRRPELAERRASSSSTLTGQPVIKSGRAKSKSRDREGPGTPPQDEEEEISSRTTKKVKKDKTVVGSLASANTSDWESATDSPAPTVKPLPTVGHEGVSGLGRVIGVGDSVEAAMSGSDGSDKVTEQVRSETPTKAGRVKGRAMFEIDDREDEEDESPPLPREQLPPNAVHPPSHPVDNHPQFPPPTTPIIGEVHPSTPSPQETPSPKPKASTSTPAPSQPIASTSESPTTSPHRPHRHRNVSMRKSSNASLVSMNSVRSLAASFSGLMGPAPGLRRSASGAAPVLDRGEVQAHLTGDTKRQYHQRTDSLNSVRSLRSVAEGAHPGPGIRRSATTLGLDNRDQRPRSSGGSESSSAITALGNLSGRTSTMGPPTRNSSGYFASLRGFAGLTPPISTSSPAARRANTQLSTSASSKGKMKPSPTQFQPVISKFVEPAPSVLDTALSVSPAHSKGLLGPGRSLSSASLTAGGVMSRTQQKALLARDAPYWANGTGPTSAEPSPSHIASSSTFYAQLPLPPPVPPTQSLPNQQQAGGTGSGGAASGKMVRSVSGEMQRQLGMQKWAVGLVREAERIERQYRTVEKWRDPLGESLERVLQKQQLLLAPVTVSQSSASVPPVVRKTDNLPTKTRARQ